LVNLPIGWQLTHLFIFFIFFILFYFVCLTDSYNIKIYKFY